MMKKIEHKKLWRQIVQHDDVENLKKHVNNYNINMPDRRGETPLHSSIIMYALDCFDYLVENGADIHIKTLYSKETTLYLAIKVRSPHLAQKLLKGGSNNINTRCKDGFTLLHHVVDQGDLEFIPLLLQNGAKVNLQNGCGETPLDTSLNIKSLVPYVQHEIEKKLILAGGKHVNTPEKKIPKWQKKFRRCLANCQIATLSLGRVLRKCGMGKDPISIIVKMVQETKENDIWKMC